MSFPFSIAWSDSTVDTVSEMDDERALVELAQRDSRAMGQLYRAHYGAIARYVHRRIPNVDEADDVVAEVFVQMVRHLPKYRHRGIPFRFWLFRVANSQVSRWARKCKKRSRERLAEYEIESCTVTESQNIDKELVAIVLASLPRRLQSVLALHYLEGLKVVEIASIERCSVGTIKSRLFDGRALMRTRLEKRGFSNERS